MSRRVVATTPTLPSLQIMDLLLQAGADITLLNDSEETALDVSAPSLRKLIVGSITHEDRAMSNAQALLQSAWIGDAVSVKKYLVGLSCSLCWHRVLTCLSLFCPLCLPLSLAGSLGAIIWM